MQAEPIWSATRAAVKAAAIAAVAVLLTNGAAHAQLGSPTSNPPFGVLAPGSTVGRVGIPLGATELPNSGLSPGALGATTGASPIPPSTMIGATAPGNGLSPNAAPPTSFGPGLPTYGITNFGTGGVQSLPGSPISGTAGIR